jgi:hypothetical protein
MNKIPGSDVGPSMPKKATLILKNIPPILNEEQSEHAFIISPCGSLKFTGSFWT